MVNAAGGSVTQVVGVAPAAGSPIAVKVLADSAEMGRVAAADIASALRDALARKPRVRVIFAAAPSQQTMLDALVTSPDIDWARIEAFHMDEYLCLAADHASGFGNWLNAHLFGRLPFAEVHLIPAGGAPAQVAQDYARLLDQAPIDIVCMGIGVNGHIAFNDPPVADFDDQLDVKAVRLDEICRQQQVDDGCFATLADVPAEAITLTVPRLLRADQLFVVVPAASKRAAVRAALHGPVTTDCPASILRTHPNCHFYLDKESYPDAHD